MRFALDSDLCLVCLERWTSGASPNVALPDYYRIMTTPNQQGSTTCPRPIPAEDICGAVELTHCETRANVRAPSRFACLLCSTRQDITTDLDAIDKS